MNKTSTFKDRINMYMRITGSRITDIARLTSIEKGTISAYANGRYKPKQQRVQEIADALNVSSAWLDGYDVPMEETGTSLKPLPIVGTVSCGLPVLADENIQGYFDLDHNSKADFCLIANGDSMIGDGIHDGDYVFVRQNAEIRNNSIVVALIDDDATLKHFHRHGDIIILKASNPKYDDIVLTKEQCHQVNILGVCVGYYSQLEN